MILGLGSFVNLMAKIVLQPKSSDHNTYLLGEDDLAPKKSSAPGKIEKSEADQPNFIDGFHERLNQIFDLKQLPPAGQGRTNQLSQVLPKISKSTARRMASGEGFPNVETLNELQRAFGVSTDWLINGKGQPFQKGELANNIPSDWEIVLVAKSTRSTDAKHEIAILVLPNTDPLITLVRAQDDAMEPTISEGDNVIVHSGTREIIDGSIYLLETPRGNVFRRVEKSFGGGWCLVPTNAKYRAETVASIALDQSNPADVIRVLGIAVANVFLSLR